MRFVGCRGYKRPTKVNKKRGANERIKRKVTRKTNKTFSGSGDINRTARHQQFVLSIFNKANNSNNISGTNNNKHSSLTNQQQTTKAPRVLSRALASSTHTTSTFTATVVGVAVVADIPFPLPHSQPHPAPSRPTPVRGVTPTHSTQPLGKCSRGAASATATASHRPRVRAPHGEHSHS